MYRLVPLDVCCALDNHDVFPYSFLYLMYSFVSFIRRLIMFLDSMYLDAVYCVWDALLMFPEHFVSCLLVPDRPWFLPATFLKYVFQVVCMMVALASRFSDKLRVLSREESSLTMFAN